MSKAKMSKANGSRACPIFKHTSTSGELKKMNFNTFNYIVILGVGAPNYLEFFITRFEESYFVQIRLSLVIGKALRSKIF